MLKFLGLAVVAAAVGVAAANLPDLKRYLRMRSM
ncbi:DUF6893 family small protein [Kitasatospora viridis]|uniref:Uncharacterized protein n=1 Tax=Kitasatospora viridis TaxID=281105 RepID=A0A561SDR6_9ACTN|nr:hypothetical protein FHX73_16163 [Kitasatospora viridis]